MTDKGIAEIDAFGIAEIDTVGIVEIDAVGLVSFGLEAAGAVPVANVIAPVISGTAQQGATLTVTPGTWTGAPVLTYQWYSNGVALSGETGTTLVPTLATVGSTITAREIPNGDTGSEVASNGLGPILYAVLHPRRASGSDLYLQDSGGQITDSGTDGPVPALDYGYDGSGSSVELRIDAVGADGGAIVDGDAVGSPFLWDSVGGVGLGTVVGLPASARDSGLNAFSGVTDFIQQVNFGARSTIAIDVTVANWATVNARLVQIQPTGSGWLLLARSGGIQFGRYVNEVLQGSSLTTIAVSTAHNGARVQIIATDSGTGNLIVRTYTAAGALISAGSQTGGSAVAACGIVDIGARASGNGVIGAFTGTVHRIRAWSAALSATEVQDVADGTATSGWQADTVGLRTGVYDPASSTRLIYTGGSGSAVVAEDGD